MKNKHYAPRNKKPSKSKNKHQNICVDDIPDSYFINSNNPRSRRTPQIPYLLNHRTSIVKNRFN